MFDGDPFYLFILLPALLGVLGYKFCVYREAVKGLTGPTLKRILDEVLLSLYSAHEGKKFDVTDTVYDGAAEQ